MLNLLKADLKRAVKDKLFFVLLIIAGVFALTTPLINRALFLLIDIEGEEGIEMLGLEINAKTIFFSSFSPSNNFGLILKALTV